MTILIVVGAVFMIGAMASTMDVKEKARRTSALSKLRNIGASFKVATDNGAKQINDRAFSIDYPGFEASRMPEMMQLLAFFGGIDDASQWYLDGDPLNANFTPPRKVFLKEGGRIVAAPGTYVSSISWTTYVPSIQSDEGTIPLFWTRGLSDAGRWDVGKDSVWGSAGGHIYFASGRVEWFDDVVKSENQFVSRRTGRETSSWKEAVSSSFRGRELPAR
jgi:hypothetical protein